MAMDRWDQREVSRAFAGDDGDKLAQEYCLAVVYAVIAAQHTQQGERERVSG